MTSPRLQSLLDWHAAQFDALGIRPSDSDIPPPPQPDPGLEIPDIIRRSGMSTDKCVRGLTQVIGAIDRLQFNLHDIISTPPKPARELTGIEELALWNAKITDESGPDPGRGGKIRLQTRHKKKYETNP